jgi:hypothetical protein
VLEVAAVDIGASTVAVIGDLYQVTGFDPQRSGIDGDRHKAIVRTSYIVTHDTYSYSSKSANIASQHSG